jgi:threonine aldolase
LENTSNRCGGTVLRPDYLWRVRQVADAAKVPIHLDGARLANAAVALGLPVKDLAAPFDSVQFDLSKGLAAPVGGIVAGSGEFIEKAKRARKLLGGGMRQAGIIAAAGIIAIEQMIDRLADDHRNARRLAEGLSTSRHLSINLESVQTNLVFVTIEPPIVAMKLSHALKAVGIRVVPRGNRMRFVTHYQISAADIEKTIEVVHQAIDRQS